LHWLQMLMLYFPCEDGEESPRLKSLEKRVLLFWQELYLEAEGDGLVQKFKVLRDARDKFAQKNRRIFDRARFLLFCPYSLTPDEHKRYLATGHKTVCEFLSPSVRRGASAYEKVSKEVYETLIRLSKTYDKTVRSRLKQGCRYPWCAEALSCPCRIRSLIWPTATRRSHRMAPRERHAMFLLGRI
jgi:hypothetical protein